MTETLDVEAEVRRETKRLRWTTAKGQNSHPSKWLETLVGVLLVALMLFPVYWMVNVSLQPTARPSLVEIFPSSPSLDGYISAFEQQGSNLRTSLLVAVGTVILSLLIAIPASYALSRLRWRIASTALLLVLISQMIPSIIIANAVYGMYVNLGLLNSIPGLILADASLGIPFAILITTAAMRGVPRDLYDAATVDGAGQLRILVRIAVPVARNGIITAALFVFLFAWGDFLFALTLTTSPEVRPVTLGLYTYIGSYVNDWSTVMATAVLASIPALLLLVIAQRFIAAGTTTGSLK